MGGIAYTSLETSIDWREAVYEEDMKKKILLKKAFDTLRYRYYKRVLHKTMALHNKYYLS